MFMLMINDRQRTSQRHCFVVLAKTWPPRPIRTCPCWRETEPGCFLMSDLLKHNPLQSPILGPATSSRSAVDGSWNHCHIRNQLSNPKLEMIEALYVNFRDVLPSSNHRYFTFLGADIETNFCRSTIIWPLHRLRLLPTVKKSHY